MIFEVIFGSFLFVLVADSGNIYRHCGSVHLRSQTSAVAESAAYVVLLPCCVLITSLFYRTRVYRCRNDGVVVIVSPQAEGCFKRASFRFEAGTVAIYCAAHQQVKKTTVSIREEWWHGVSKDGRYLGVRGQGV